MASIQMADMFSVGGNFVTLVTGWLAWLGFEWGADSHESFIVRALS
jgi:hypothetical protein